MTDVQAAMEHGDLPASVSAAVLAHPDVRDVRLVGSRAGGTPSALSDWDFEVHVDVGAFPRVRADLPSLVAVLEPLAEQWDRLNEYWCYMLMLHGPVKVDLIFPRVPFRSQPAWTVTAGTLEGIDRHFWDWILWLASKRERGKEELVGAELRKMRDHLLGPMGVSDVPATIPVAIAAYLAARDRLESELGVAVPRALEREVLRVVPAA